jgi:hypothetical protein
LRVHILDFNTLGVLLHHLPKELGLENGDLADNMFL